MKLFYDANDRPIEPPDDSLDDNFTLREDEIPDDSFETTPELACSQALYIEPATFIDIFSIRPL
jgi:hypothetical protein